MATQTSASEIKIPRGALPKYFFSKMNIREKYGTSDQEAIKEARIEQLRQFGYNNESLTEKDENLLKFLDHADALFRTFKARTKAVKDNTTYISVLEDQWTPDTALIQEYRASSFPRMLDHFIREIETVAIIAQEKIGEDTIEPLHLWGRTLINSVNEDKKIYQQLRAVAKKLIESKLNSLKEKEA